MRKVLSQADDPVVFEQLVLTTASGEAVGEFEDLTRQEFKDDCDVKTVLERHGVEAFARNGARGPIGRVGVEVDQSIDLQMAYAMGADLAAAYGRSPPIFRRAYPSLESFFRALATASVDPSLWRSEEAAPPVVPAGTSAPVAAPAP